MPRSCAQSRNRQGRPILHTLSLNEAVVGKGSQGRLIEFELLDRRRVRLSRCAPTASSSPRRPARPPTRCRRRGRSCIRRCRRSRWCRSTRTRSRARPVSVSDTSVHRDRAACAPLDARAHFDGFALTDLHEGDRLVLQALGRRRSRFVHPPGYQLLRHAAREAALERERSDKDRGSGLAMLRALDIRDFVIVGAGRARSSAPASACSPARPAPGKSILVDAIELLVGGRGDAAVGARGRRARRAFGRVRVRRTRPLAALARRAGARRATTAMVILRRTIDRSGRSRSLHQRPRGDARAAARGGRAPRRHPRPARAPVAAARRRAARAARRARRRAGAARATAPRRAAPGSGWKRWRARPRSTFAQREAERAELQETVAELKKLALARGRVGRAVRAAPAPRARLEPARRRAVVARGARRRPTAPACRSSSAVASRLRALSEHDDRLKAIVEMLESAEAQAGEAARELRHYASRVDLDPEALRAGRERASRRCTPRRASTACKPGGAAARLREARAALRGARARGESGSAASAKWRPRASRYDAAAKKLSAKRKSAAQALSRAVTRGDAAAGDGGRPLLGRAEARWRTRRRRAPRTVEFEVASHPSLPLRPLAQVASGGELSRISLAIQLVAAQRLAGRHAGVRRGRFRHRRRGGRDRRPLAAASSASERQVLCVTHLPQVAAQGDEQWSVSQSGGAARSAASREARSRRRGSRSSRACWAARKSPHDPQARGGAAAADRTPAEAGAVRAVRLGAVGVQRERVAVQLEAALAARLRSGASRSRAS